MKENIIFDSPAFLIEGVTAANNGKLGYHSCPFSYGPWGAFKCHLLANEGGKTSEVKCPRKGEAVARPDCPLREGVIVKEINGVVFTWRVLKWKGVD